MSPLPLPERPEPERSILMPLAFWMCLFSSAFLFAAVSLAPRIVEWHASELESLERQQRLIGLERRIQQLEKIAYALEFDPEFRNELARNDVSAGELMQTDFDTPNIPLTVPWYIPVFRALAVAGGWRRRLLWIAGGLCVFAFMILRDTTPENSRMV